MGSDLVTRLRALADSPHPTPQIQRALREAADALENDYNCAQEVIAELTEDRDALKAELAECVTQVGEWGTRAGKAEAEAAALLEKASRYEDALRWYAEPRPGSMLTKRALAALEEKP